ncbi:MAG: hypothetical protein DRO00_05375 [Thermoproteota archaeon]|nr:MAG: hypothetical protein DRN92_00685 [Candidatus Korarchaeota archaeon]RLG49290.1 MAG: hypothetical protein DRN90_02025 [Candidatus Korarchaeota archaeon]RLG52605.1 MAG: hypothetical protein DRO00_05375 [Candidatus Korarchaeota archaeon]
MKSKEEKKKSKRIDSLIEEYDKLKNDVERAIRISIRIKIHKPESITDEEFKALEKDPEFKKMVEDLVISYVKGKREIEG